MDSSGLAQDPPALELGIGPLTRAALASVGGVDLLLVARPMACVSSRPPGPSGLDQIGALNRSNDCTRWHLTLLPDDLTRDLAGLATAAGIDIA